MPINLNQEQNPINPDDPKYMLMLSYLQGNILKSHGRDYAAHLFVQFTSKTKEVKQWIADFTNRFVTSALRQQQETQEYKLNSISGRAFGGIYLSAAGYRKLGFDPAQFVEPQDGISPATFFKDGLEKGRQLLNDPAPNTWDEGYRGRRIHALILLADEDPRRLEDVRKRVEKSFNGLVKIVAREDGLALRDASNKPVEQFGYRDGISQPLYYQADVLEEHDKFGTDKWDPSAPLDLVLVKDPLATKDDAFGSYFVFRKLEQNVKGFKDREDLLADELGLTGDDRERAGALVVGRFENGVPVLLSDKENNPALKDVNNFHFGADAEGNKCPFAAHIRKTNPRGDTGLNGGQVNEAERRHRITRRGITYGKRQLRPDGRPTLEDRPSKNVGLLFMCFQSSIPNQFGFMQAVWANNANFSKPQTGQDPVIGQAIPPNKAGGQSWPPVWGGAARQAFNFGDFVQMKGGEYFFAPSIPFLRGLNGELGAVTADQAEFQVEGTGAFPAAKKKTSEPTPVSWQELERK